MEDNTEVNLLIENFKSKLQLFESKKGFLDDNMIREQVKQTIKDLDVLATQIKSLLSDSSSPLKESFLDFYQQYLNEKIVVQAQIQQKDETSRQQASGNNNGRHSFDQGFFSSEDNTTANQDQEEVDDVVENAKQSLLDAKIKMTNIDTQASCFLMQTFFSF